MSRVKQFNFEAGDLDRLDDLLIKQYESHGIPADRLAYTPEFDSIHARLHEAGDMRSKTDVFGRLLSLRKSGRLPRLPDRPRLRLSEPTSEPGARKPRTK